MWQKQLVILLFTIGATPSAFAYLDPGTGSMIIQGAIAAIAMVGLTVKTYWYRLKDWFSPNVVDESAEGESKGEA